MCKPGKMLGCLLRRLAHDRYVQATTNDFCDFSKWHPFVGDAMIGGFGGALFQRESEQLCGVELMDCRPAIESVADIRRNAFVARHIDKSRHECVIALAMHGRRK